MLWLTIALSALTILMAILGGIVAEVPLKIKYIFLIAGVVMFGLIILQSTLNDRDIRNRDDKIDQMNISVSNMQGQLTAFRDFMSNYLISETPKRHSSEIPVSVKELPNPDLKNNIIKLSKNMMDFEFNFKKEEYQRDLAPLKGTEEEKNKLWQQRTNMMLQRNLEYKKEFNKRFLSDALIYRDELLNRLNLIPPKEEKDIIALKGFLAGPSPVSDLAIYLEKLAKQL